MQLEVGMILEGKVTGITKFGAFVALPEGKSGLVHISEIANTYVSDVHDYVQEGQTVKVKLIGITPEGKINLSMKKAEPAPPRQEPRQPRPAAPTQRQSAAARAPQPRVNGPTTDSSFEDKLKQFMQDSDSRIADNKMYNDHRSSRRKK